MSASIGSVDSRFPKVFNIMNDLSIDTFIGVMKRITQFSVEGLSELHADQSHDVVMFQKRQLFISNVRFSG